MDELKKAATDAVAALLARKVAAVVADAEASNISWEEARDTITQLSQDADGIIFEINEY